MNAAFKPHIPTLTCVLDLQLSRLVNMWFSATSALKSRLLLLTAKILVDWLQTSHYADSRCSTLEKKKQTSSEVTHSYTTLNGNTVLSLSFALPFHCRKVHNTLVASHLCHRKSHHPRSEIYRAQFQRDWDKHSRPSLRPALSPSQRHSLRKETNKGKITEPEFMSCSSNFN